MMPGRDKFFRCPTCGDIGSVGTLASGNTFGATWWTDGKMVAPWLPEFPLVTRCPKCRSFYWIDDAPWTKKTFMAWIFPRRVSTLTEAEYLEALSSGLGRNRSEEIFLRLRAWWAHNDAKRHRPALIEPTREEGSDLSGAARDNLLRLLEILDMTNDNERLLKAEAARQLGEFGRALEILNSGRSDEHARFENELRTLIEKRDCRVREVDALE